VSVLVAAVVPEIVTGEVIAHVGAVGLLSELVTVHVRLTAPVNPATGVTVIVDVFPDVAPVARVSVPGLAPSVRPGTGAVVVTTIVNVVVALILPVAASVPVTVAL
jgi:hypothetical protein